MKHMSAKMTATSSRQALVRHPVGSMAHGARQMTPGTGDTPQSCSPRAPLQSLAHISARACGQRCKGVGKALEWARAGGGDDDDALALRGRVDAFDLRQSEEDDEVRDPDEDAAAHIWWQRE